MRRRIARKIEKWINRRLAECPRVGGRGYSEGVRLRAVQKLYPRAQLRIECLPASVPSELERFVDICRSATLRAFSGGFQFFRFQEVSYVRDPKEQRRILMSDRKFYCETAVQSSPGFVRCEDPPAYRVRPDEVSLDPTRWTVHCTKHGEMIAVAADRVPFDPARGCGSFMGDGLADEEIMCGAPAVWIMDEVLHHDLNRRAVRCAEHIPPHCPGKML